MWDKVELEWIVNHEELVSSDSLAEIAVTMSEDLRSVKSSTKILAALGYLRNLKFKMAYQAYLERFELWLEYPIGDGSRVIVKSFSGIRPSSGSVNGKEEVSKYSDKFVDVLVENGIRRDIAESIISQAIKNYGW